MKQVTWWKVTAGLIGGLMVMTGIGNLIEEDGGPLYGQLVLLAVMATGAALVVAGLVSTRLRRETRYRLVALGVLPGTVGLAFFWFPPAVAVGILAVATSLSAFRASFSAPIAG